MSRVKSQSLDPIFGISSPRAQDSRSFISSFFSGKYCEHADHSCATAPCQNGGSCRPDSKHPATAYTCHCRLGFYGEHCEFEIDECLNAPCANGGVCHNLQVCYFAFPVPRPILIEHQGDFECECAPGWMGKTCQIGESIIIAIISSKSEQKKV